MKKHLIVGLGNVGESYLYTRHNIGFEILNYFAHKYEQSFLEKRYGHISNIKIKNQNIFLLKPSTYMNLSGKAINYYIKELKISIENLLIISDDIDLDFCSLKLKPKGGHGGHNGHRNIIETLNTNSYARLRFGIGKNYIRGNQVNYVLSKWSEEEMFKIKELIPVTHDIIKSYVFEGIEKTMNTFN